MDISYIVDAVTVAVSLGGSYVLSRYGTRLRNKKDFIPISDDGKHVHSFDHVYSDGQWRCGVITNDGVCEVVKDFE